MHQDDEHNLIELLDDGEHLVTYFCAKCNMIFTMNLQTGEETDIKTNVGIEQYGISEI